MSTIVFWFRRDLRLGDNPALRAAIDAAVAESGSVLPIFIDDSRLRRASGANRLAFLDGALGSLRDDGVPIVRRSGDPVEEVVRVVRESGARQVFFTEDFAPYGLARDAGVTSMLESVGVKVHVVDSPYASAPGSITKLDGSAYRVFTPFSKVWLPRVHGCQPARTVDPRKVPWAALSSTGGPALVSPTAAIPESSERFAHDRLRAFVQSGKLEHYDETRNFASLDATSRLSTFLKFGLLHPRQILASVRAEPVSAGSSTFVKELCWRDFYADVLYREPASARHELDSSLSGIEFDSGPVAQTKFEAWKAGMTGFPFVDAGMRQLREEGWMHNRVRMVVASFLVKDLHLDWRWGARWFMANLVDGDLASNQHGWQWTAGTGTDAAPYFRVFNPTSQGKRFDPDGTYIRRYVPELSPLSNKLIHEPWLNETAVRNERISYPKPIVDHAREREVALGRYRVAKGGSTGLNHRTERPIGA